MRKFINPSNENVTPMSKATAIRSFKFYKTLDKAADQLYKLRKDLLLKENEVGTMTSIKLASDYTKVVQKIEEELKRFHNHALVMSKIELEEEHEEAFEALVVETERVSQRHEKVIAKMAEYPECVICYGQYDPCLDGETKYFNCMHREWHFTCIRDLAATIPAYRVPVCPMCRAPMKDDEAVKLGRVPERDEQYEEMMNFLDNLGDNWQMFVNEPQNPEEPQLDLEDMPNPLEEE